MAKYRQVKVNLRPEDYDALERQAIAEEISMAELFRQAVGVGIPDRRDRNMNEERLALIYELKKIGTNINQIAKHVNTEKVIDRAALDALIEIQRELKRTLK